MLQPLKSKCCQAELITRGSDEGTYHYECTKCSNPSDPYCEPQPESTKMVEINTVFTVKEDRCTRCNMRRSECGKNRWEEPLCVVGRTQYDAHFFEENSQKNWESEFNELLSHFKASKELPNTAINELRRKPNSQLESEIKSFISTLVKSTEERVRKEERSILLSKAEELKKAIQKITPPNKAKELPKYMMDNGKRSMSENVLNLIDKLLK